MAIFVDALPYDVCLEILKWSSVGDLTRLSQVSKRYHELVENDGWRRYVRQNARYLPSLSKLIPYWSPRECARYVYLSDLAWSTRTLQATLLSGAHDNPRSWQVPSRALSLSESVLVTSSGPDLEIFDFEPGAKHEGHSASWIFHSLRLGIGPNRAESHICGITVVPGSIWASPNQDVEICIARETTLTRVRILRPSRGGRIAGDGAATASDVQVTATYQRPRNPSSIQLLTSSRHLIMTISNDCTLSLYDSSSPWVPPRNFKPPRSGDKKNVWCAQLSLTASTPFVAFGGSIPLSLYTLENFESQRNAFAVLSDESNYPPSAYSLCRPSGDSTAEVSPPWGSTDQVIASGWHDGIVRFHDLRSDHRDKEGSLLPVLRLDDKTSPGGALYCLAIGGGGGTHVVGGRANHGIVSIWDLRNVNGTIYDFDQLGSNDNAHIAGGGWSVFPPQSNWSPTYNLALEGSRIWGVGNQGVFLMDFSPRGQLEDTNYIIPTVINHNAERSIVVNP
ncbi:uncharacterized protein EI90DRAFT_2964768 [Cantharellus anzutake]|uniref:uncharacterized protein n=1 Tax=Cantharellus anzutake TaxID=1750568 RepID=UPI00190670DF|nr:uncharacterized protein EI90DRAFT_2964768 [Cantharellus anzutake]KAF8342915.1 hypothetical protein EI90DRAFT_2964768 [Cantharellus anzutake]